jgi:hypothetical protein
MTREVDPHLDPEGDPDGPPEPEGRLQPTSYAVLTAWALGGLVLGWAWKRIAEAVNGIAPVVSWGQPAALWLVAAAVGVTWWQTHRAVQVRRERLEPHRAVNRLVLARAGALVGSLVAGGYAGYAVAWIGDPAELAGQRILRSVVAVLAGLAMVAGALLLERACRVRKGPGEP